MNFVVTKMAQLLEHRTLGNFIEQGLLSYGFDFLLSFVKIFLTE